MLRSIKICSVKDRPCWNNPCSSRNCASTVSQSLTSRTVQKAFPGTDSSVILRQLVMFPFFSNFTIMPWCHSSGTCSSSPTFIHQLCQCLYNAIFQKFCGNLVLTCCLAALQFFQCLLHLINCVFSLAVLGRNPWGQKQKCSLAQAGSEFLGNAQEIFEE